MRTISANDHLPNALLKKNLNTFDKSLHSIISTARFAKIYAGLKPLITTYKDAKGRCIQLWKVDPYGLIGTVLDPQDGLRIIPQRKIYNPLNTKQTPRELIQCLENTQNSCWDIAYDAYQLALTIWPHLQAAGREDTRPLVSKKLEQLESAQKSAVKVTHFPDGRIRYYKEEKPSETEGPTTGGCIVTEYHQKRGSVRTWYECHDKDGEINRIHHKKINGREILRFHMPLTGKEEAFVKKYEEEAAAKKALNQKGGSSAGKSPATKDFQQKLQQTRLTESYNATHRQNPVLPKGATGGDIGGVACSPAYIEGLFDNPESLFEKEHFFCVPGLPDGKLPFSNIELRQIIRELAIGVYVHSAIPFFSLHFNEQSNQYPIIHPAYENTLVGRVISMLDYTMKGYLNGGIFTEEFIDGWLENPNWQEKEKAALEQLIDFQEYCKKHGLEEYLSLRDFQKMTDVNSKNIFEKAIEKIEELALGVEPETEDLQNFKGFNNSFRIIAKQNSIRKEKNLFLIDADFDVLYTIDPSPGYKAALENYMRKHGVLPDSHLHLENTYRVFCQRIHDNMVKIPLCRNYFAMLGIINFFSSYFSTLKKHRKVPALSPMTAPLTKGSPALFPYLPIRSSLMETLKNNPNKLIVKMFKKHGIKTEAYFNQIRKNLFISSAPNVLQEKEELLSIICLEMQNQCIQSASHADAVKQKIQDSKEIQQLISKVAETIIEAFESTAVDTINELKNSFIQVIPKISREHEIEALLNRFIVQDRVQLEEYFLQLYEAIIQVTEPNANMQENLTAKIVERAQQNIPQLRYTRAREVSEKLLECIQSNFTAIVSKMYSIFSERFPEELVNEWIDIVNVPVSRLRIMTEIKPIEIETGEKIVGRCSMQLQKQVIRTCQIANGILCTHRSKFQKIPSEEWTEISYGLEKSTGFVFRLAHENVPSWLHDYGWMESLLLVPSGTDNLWIQEQLHIEEAIKEERKDDFVKLVHSSTKLQQMKDRSKRTLMHHAACLQDVSYVKILQEKNSRHLLKISMGINLCITQLCMDLYQFFDFC